MVVEMAAAASTSAAAGASTAVEAVVTLLCSQKGVSTADDVTDAGASDSASRLAETSERGLSVRCGDEVPSMWVDGTVNEDASGEGTTGLRVVLETLAEDSVGAVTTTEDRRCIESSVGGTDTEAGDIGSSACRWFVETTSPDSQDVSGAVGSGGWDGSVDCVGSDGSVECVGSAGSAGSAFAFSCTTPMGGD